jgi:hypothetical protein
MVAMVAHFARTVPDVASHLQHDEETRLAIAEKEEGTVAGIPMDPRIQVE